MSADEYYSLPAITSTLSAASVIGASAAADAADALASLKRRASPSFEEASTSRKRFRDLSAEPQTDVRRAPADHVSRTVSEVMSDITKVDGQALADDLESELECGICSALVYKPVVVNPCQHFFCGSCCQLWIRNGGHNCPACRGISTTALPSRALQTMVDVLLRNCPSRSRTERERAQADEVYKAGTTLRIPIPPPKSPPPQIPTSDSHARPCPHCHPDNPFGYRCSQPIRDPDSHPDQAWNLDDGPPPGHGFCGNCEDLLALQAPSTTRCDFCEVPFCGIGVQGRCSAASIENAQPQGFSDIRDFIQSTELYECFDSNSVEVEILLDYLGANSLRPQDIYREIVRHIKAQPRGFAPLIELDLFNENGGPSNAQTDPSAPRNRMCRVCASEVLMWGIREWWVRERKDGGRMRSRPRNLPSWVSERADCPEGSACSRQREQSHAREFNHIIAQRELRSPRPHASPRLSPRISDLLALPIPDSLPPMQAPSRAAIFAELTRDLFEPAPPGFNTRPFPDDASL